MRREKGVKKRNVPFQGTRPQFPCTRQRFNPVTFPLGRPRATTALSIRDSSQKSRLSSAGDQHNGVSGSTWIPPPCWIPSATSCFGCPGWPGHRNRDGTSNTSEEIACRAFENIYSRNFPRNNAVFHPVPSFPRTGYSDNKLGDDKPPPFRSHIPRNSRTCCNFISSFPPSFLFLTQKGSWSNS